MKTFGFNLLPQKSKAIQRKEDKRDSYSIAIALLPLSAALVWLALILINYFIAVPTKTQAQSEVNETKAFIESVLAPILVANGEVVTKTNTLANVIKYDIAPEKLFTLIDNIYKKQENDASFQIKGYSRNNDGSFSVALEAGSYQRLSEIVRRFATDATLGDVKLDAASKDTRTNRIIGTISFNFIYQNAGTTTK